MRMTPGKLKFFLNIYGPLVGAAIRIDYIRDDWREVHVSMKMRWYNRNVAGVHFGGSLYAMVDAPYMLMLMNLLGSDYIVWDKAADIDFIKPGKGKVRAVFLLSEQAVEDIKSHTAEGEKYLPSYNVKVIDEDGDIVANVNKTLYIKKKIK